VAKHFFHILHQQKHILEMYFWGNYRVFQGFGQAKIPYSGLVLGSSQFSLLPQLPQKTSGQI